MRIGQGCPWRDSFWYWVLFVMTAAVTLPGAACVAAQNNIQENPSSPHGASEAGRRPLPVQPSTERSDAVNGPPSIRVSDKQIAPSKDAALELHNVTFCRTIFDYGTYDRIRRNEFTAGQGVLLYAEFENFKCEPTAAGAYRAILKATIEIFDRRGSLVQSIPWQASENVCANHPRRDYYNSYEFYIPSRIGPGPHTLKLTVEDQVSRKVAASTVTFAVK